MIKNQNLVVVTEHKYRHELCKKVDANSLKFDQDQIKKVNKVSFGVIMLGTVKCNLSLQIDKKMRIDREIVTQSPAVNGALYVLAPLL